MTSGFWCHRYSWTKSFIKSIFLGSQLETLNLMRIGRFEWAPNYDAVGLERF